MLDALWPVFFWRKCHSRVKPLLNTTHKFLLQKNKSFWKSTFTKEWYNVKNSMMTSYIFEERQIRNCRLVWGFLKSWLKTVNRFLYLVISVSIDYTLIECQCCDAFSVSQTNAYRSPMIFPHGWVFQSPESLVSASILIYPRIMLSNLVSNPLIGLCEE